MFALVMIFELRCCRSPRETQRGRQAVRQRMGWRLSIGLCHASVLLSEMTAQAFAPAGHTSSSTAMYRHHHKPEFRHSSRSPSLDQRRPATTRLEATPQQSDPDSDVWWDGDIDPWTEAKSRVRRCKIGVEQLGIRAYVSKQYVAFCGRGRRRSSQQQPWLCPRVLRGSCFKRLERLVLAVGSEKTQQCLA